GEPMQRSDEDDRTGLHRQREIADVAKVRPRRDAALGTLEQVGQVGTGAEAGAGPGEGHDSRARAFGMLELPRQRQDQRWVQGVAGVRPVQRPGLDVSDSTGLEDVGHWPPRTSASCLRSTARWTLPLGVLGKLATN